jgi:hypothetical protein
MSKMLYQRQIPLAIVAIWSLIMVAAFYLNIPALATIRDELVLWGVIIAYMLMLFTNVMLVYGNARTLASSDERSRERQRAFWFLFALVTIIGIAIINYPAMENSDAWTSYDITIRYSLVGLQLFSISGWTWAEFVRLRRVMSLEGLIFYAVFINQICSKVSVLVSIWPGFVDISTWISSVPHAGAQRAALACLGLGALALGIRAFVGKEPGILEMEAV